MLEWERDWEKKEKKKRKWKKKFFQEDQMLELTFNFHGVLSILTFSKNKLTLFTKKHKRKAKEKKTKQKKERKKREEKEK